jgi:acetyltransferase
MAIVINVTPLLSNPIDIMDAIAEITQGHAKPVLAVMMATEAFYEEMKTRTGHPPVYRFPESAARALSKLSRYADWCRRPADALAPEFDVDDEAVARILDETGEGYLEDAPAFQVLRHYGIPLVAGRRVATREQALEAAKEIGYPVVLKAIGTDLVHKSDVGAVRLDLRDSRELTTALGEIEFELGGLDIQPAGWLVQRMAGKGHEVIFGISTDERFGPLLMFGLGGKYVEVFRDVRFGVTPLSVADARDMIRGVRGFELLQGVRGEEAADLELLEEILLRLNQLVARHPRIQELDINPFLAAPRRDECLALDVRIRVG